VFVLDEAGSRVDTETLIIERRLSAVRQANRLSLSTEFSLGGRGAMPRCSPPARLSAELYQR
jgi:hypothetical protein